MTLFFVIALATFRVNIHEDESVGDSAHLKSNIACSRRSDTGAREKIDEGKKNEGLPLFFPLFFPA